MYKSVMNVMTWVWLALGIVGLITDNDPVYIVGLVNTTVNAVGVGVLKALEAKKTP